MNYGLLIIALLTFVLLVVSIWLNSKNSKFLYSSIKKNREIIQSNHAKVEQLAREFIKATQLIIKYQNELDEKSDEVAKLFNQQSSIVLSHLELFDSEAKSDMLAARREELRRTKELKIALERLMGVALTSRQPASPNDVLALENINNRIAELEKILDQAERADI